MRLSRLHRAQVMVSRGCLSSKKNLIRHACGAELLLGRARIAGKAPRRSLACTSRKCHVGTASHLTASFPTDSLQQCGGLTGKRRSNWHCSDVPPSSVACPRRRRRRLPPAWETSGKVGVETGNDDGLGQSRRLNAASAFLLWRVMMAFTLDKVAAVGVTVLQTRQLSPRLPFFSSTNPTSFPPLHLSPLLHPIPSQTPHHIAASPTHTLPIMMDPMEILKKTSTLLVPTSTSSGHPSDTSFPTVVPDLPEFQGASETGIRTLWSARPPSMHLPSFTNASTGSSSWSWLLPQLPLLPCHGPSQSWVLSHFPNSPLNLTMAVPPSLPCHYHTDHHYRCHFLLRHGHQARRLLEALQRH